MKKLFLSLLALVAMVVTANAQRAWAYDLSLTSESESYTFTFKATTAATATLILSDKEGNNVGTLDLGAVVAGSNTFTYTTDQLPKAGKMNWAVKLAGEAIAAGTELELVGSDDFYNMMGVVVDNNPESHHFSKIYIQQSYEYPGSGNTVDRNKTQTSGIYIYDQGLNELNNPVNTGIVPNVPEAYKATFGANRDAMKRLAINPITGQLAFCHNISGLGSVWAMNRDDMTAAATNLIDGITAFNKPNSLCFDEDGTLFVLADGGYSSSLGSLGTIYKIVDGTATAFSTFKYANGENAIASDGKGGLWVAQQRNNLDGFSAYTHHKANGEVDYTVTKNSSAEVKSLFQHTAEYMSKRGAIAYDVKRDILAVGGDKKVILFSVAYDPTTGAPTLTKLLATPTIGSNIDGIAFDYAGDVYVVSSASEKFYKFEVPTETNVCTTPAPKAQVLINTDQTVYAITIAVNEEAMGTVTGAGNYLAGESATLTATANAGYKFVSWTVGEETKTENPLTLTVNSNLTVTANFAVLSQYTITATANDATMGSVTGAGKYTEGDTVTLKAVANKGHEFVDWSNGATEATLTFVATKDSTVQANFKVLSYTVALATNDENKGTVAGAGTYDYGTEVELTATAADGYELLYWSDRSTENPRTITVDGNEALSAYFVKTYTQEPTFTIEKLWENTNVPSSTNNGYQAVGWDGKIYMQDAGNSKIMSYANGTDAAVEYAASGAGQQIAVDEAGNLIVFNAYFATATPNAVLIYPKGNTEGKAVSFTLLQPARCDFFSASGNIYSAEGGYIYFYCNGKTVINRLKITNGAATAADVTTDVVGGSIYATPQNTNHVMVDIFGNLVTHARSNAINSINVLTNECATFTLPSIKMGTLGGCSFELGGKELWAYHAGATNYSSEWNIYNMTDKKFLSDEVLYAVDKANSTNNACNWLNVQKVDEKTAYIYQFCPKKGVAAWKVTCDTGEEPGTGTAVDNTTVAPQVQKIVRDGQVLIIRDGKTFNMMGQEVR